MRQRCYSVIAKHPDNFLCEFLADNEELGAKLFEEAVRTIKSRLIKPPRTWAEMFESLATTGQNHATTLSGCHLEIRAKRSSGIRLQQNASKILDTRGGA
jgi:hypothetical protein